MFMDDEEELELLRQYEENNVNASDVESQTSNDIDSDLEDKIMSLVHYQSGVEKKAAAAAPPPPPPPQPKATVSANKATSAKETVPSSEPKVVYAPIDVNETGISNYSATAELGLDKSDSDADLYHVDVSSDEEDSQEEGEIRSPSDEKGLISEDIVIDTNYGDDAADNVSDEPGAVEEAKPSVPQVTRVIDLDEEVSTTEEVAKEGDSAVNRELEDIIKIQSRNSYLQRREPPVCLRCHQIGHIARDCSVCGRCGGPHSFCAGPEICRRCKQRGHYYGDCENPKENRPCKRCSSFEHVSQECPTLWRAYTGLKHIKNRDKQQNLYCYSCSRKGHYGDDCPLKDRGAGGSYRQNSNRNQSSKGGNRHRRFAASDDDDGSSVQSSVDTDSGLQQRKRARKKGKRGRGGYIDDDTPRSKRTKVDGQANTSNRNGGADNNRAPGNNSNTLDAFFSPQRRNNNQSQRSGNMNWRAINDIAPLPQPTRSGTVNFNQQPTGFEANFPRGDPSTLPRPTSSGVIDLTGNNNSTSSTTSSSSSRGPRYRGGYKRR